MRRLCKECGSELQKRDHEPMNRFMKKKFCSGKCARANMKKEKRGWWSAEFDQRFEEVTHL